MGGTAGCERSAHVHRSRCLSMRAVAFAVANEQGPEPIVQVDETVANVPLDRRSVDVIIAGLQTVLVSRGDHACTQGRPGLSSQRQTNKYSAITSLLSCCQSDRPAHSAYVWHLEVSCSLQTLPKLAPPAVAEPRPPVDPHYRQLCVTCSWQGR